MSAYLRECKVVLPITSEGGVSYTEHHKALAQDLLNEFGEFNRCSMDTLYKDPKTNKIHADDSVCYIINAEFRLHPRFKNIAVDYAAKCGLASVYVDTGGTGDYVDVLTHTK